MKLSLYCLLLTVFCSQFSGCSTLNSTLEKLFTEDQSYYVDNRTPDRSLEVDMLQNRSFEEVKPDLDYQNQFRALYNWSDLAKFVETPPTLFTPELKVFNVLDLPSDKSNYIGFVVRENGSYEEMYQFLNNRLEQDASYEFEIDINYSSKMMSPFPEIPQSKFYGNNAKLVIKVADSITGDNYEISQLIPNYPEQWETNKVTFISPCNCDVFILGSYYIGIITDDYYYGNIMIDNLSDIIKLEKD